MLNRTPLVEITDVGHSYNKGKGGDFLVLDNINLNLYEDEIVCLLGRSGSGKSTLMRSIAGLIKPTQGTITMQGKPLAQSRDAISMVFQTFSLFPWLTVLENVEIGLKAHNVNPEECQRRSRLAIDLIGLEGYENVYPRELSGGMQQRVGLARALVVKPLLLLMDEPFSALDILTAEILRADLLDLWIEGQMSIKSILMVTHNIEEAVLMADRILIFGAHPGHIMDEIVVTLPHPRNRLAPEFRALVDEMYEKMMTHDKKSLKEGMFPGMGIGMALPYISSNTLQGFMETMASSFKGKAELSELVDELNIDSRMVFQIAEVLQLFRFCELEMAEVHFTAQGKYFVNETMEERKKIFKAHLQKHIPLAAHILHALESDSDHSVEMSEFQSEIEQHIPVEAAEEALKAVTSWARFAELFMYDEQTKRFFL